jgi:alcohol dehydrogenase (cytochrome c)
MDRYLRAFDADNGQVLWQTRLGSQAMGYRVTYSIGGRQYIAIPVGSGFKAGALQTTPEADGPSGGNAAYVFALPQ